MWPSSKRLMGLLVRQNFSKLCENQLNKQINIELKACHEYLAMAYHFNRSDVALPGVFKFFKTASLEEREHAERLMEYMNKRGGTIVLTEVPTPKCDFGSIKDAFTYALTLEKDVNQSLLELHELAGTEGDPSLQDFVDDYLKEQVDGQKHLCDLITQIERCEKELGDFVFDINLHNSSMHKD